MFFGLCAAIFQADQTTAVTLQNLDEFPTLHGSYAPQGDCARQPRVLVDRTGFNFESKSGTEKAKTPELAMTYAGPNYAGISLWFFPFFSVDGPNPLLLTFNAGEQEGVLTVEAYDYDYPGGPKLPAKYRPLVDGSPYRKCP